MAKKIIPILFLFMLLSSFTTSVMYVTDNKSLYRSLDNVNFELAIQHNVFNASLKTAQNITKDAIRLHTDDSGRHLIFIDGNATGLTDADTRLMLSDDYGETFICYPLCNSPLYNRYQETAISSSGQYQYAISQTHFFYSTDYGKNFYNKTIASSSLDSLSVSDDGKIIIIGEVVGAGSVFVSTNYGVNFTKTNALASGSYVTVCGQDNVLYAIAQSTQQSKKSFNNGTTWVNMGNPLISASTGQTAICKNNKLMVQGKYSSDYGDTFISQPASYFDALNDMSQFYATNTTNIIQSTDGQNFTVYKTGFSNLTYIEVSQDTYVPMPTIPLCLDSSTFCANAFYSYSLNRYTCYFNDTQYCNAGCSNSTGTPVCSNDVPNNCNIIGSRKCLDSTNYAVCTDSNNDGALDYGEVHPCGLGNFCVGTFNYADCEAIPSQALYNQSLPYVTPYAVSDDLTSYSIDASSRTVSVVTSNLVHSQKFYTATSLNTNQTFISRTCDYTEQSAFEIVSPAIDKKPYVYDLTSPINTNAYIRIDLIPFNQEPVDISLTDTIGSSVGDIRLIRNTTEKKLCVQYLNGTNIYCDYSTNTYDDLKSVIVTFSYDAVSKTYSNRFDINRAISYKFITYPAYYAGNDIAHISIDSNNVTVNKISGVTTADHTPFENLRLNDLNQSPCAYAKAGSYKVRTFSSTQGYPEYTIYTDYNVNVKTLGAPSGEVAKDQGTANFLNPSNYSTGTRYFLVFLAIVIIIGAFVTMGVQVGHGEMIKAFSMTGMLLGAFIVLIAAITGWIDGWVAFALVMVCLALIIFMGFIGNNKG